MRCRISFAHELPALGLYLDFEFEVAVASFGYPAYRQGHPDTWYPGEGPEVYLLEGTCEDVPLDKAALRVLEGMPSFMCDVLACLEDEDEDFKEPDDCYDYDYESDRAADRYADELFNRGDPR